MPALAVPREQLTHVIGIGLRAALGVRHSPLTEVLEEAVYFREGTVESTDEQIAGMTDAPTAQIRAMIVVLLQLRALMAQRTHLETVLNPYTVCRIWIGNGTPIMRHCVIL